MTSSVDNMLDNIIKSMKRLAAKSGHGNIILEDIIVDDNNILLEMDSVKDTIRAIVDNNVNEKVTKVVIHDKSTKGSFMASVGAEASLANVSANTIMRSLHDKSTIVYVDIEPIGKYVFDENGLIIAYISPTLIEEMMM